MKCPVCGAENGTDAKFCGTCGANLSTETNEVVEEQPQTNESAPADTTPEVTQVPEKQETEVVDQVPETNVTSVPAEQPVDYNNPSNIKPTTSKTAIIIAVAAAVIVLVAIVIFIVFSPKDVKVNEKESINNKFDPEKLIVVRKDDNYGYINSKGKLVLPAKYESASEFYGDYAVVRAEVKDGDLTKSVYQIIDKKGKVKKQTDQKTEYLEESNMWIIDNELYNASMKKLSPTDVKVDDADSEAGYFVWVNPKKNTGGIMNAKGKITYTYKFKTGESYINVEPSDIDESLKERYCRVNVENDKYAVVNCDTGKVVYDFVEKLISVNDDNIFEINKPNSYDDESYIYIQNDKIVYKTDDPDNVEFDYYPGYLYIRDYTKSYSDGRYSYLHLDTMEIKDEKPANVKDDDKEDLDDWEKYTGLKELYQNGKYGLSNDKEIVLPAEWNDLEYLDMDLYKYLKSKKKDYIYARKDSKWYEVSLTEKKAIKEFNASYISTDEDSTFVYYTDADTNNKKVYNLLSGKSLNVPKGTYLYTNSNYVTIKDYATKTTKYYNTDLELIYTESL